MVKRNEMDLNRVGNVCFFYYFHDLSVFEIDSKYLESVWIISKGGVWSLNEVEFRFKGF